MHTFQKNSFKNKFLLLMLALSMLFAFSGCKPAASSQSSAPAPSSINKDREGNPITLPENIETIITMGPSNTEILTALGFGDKIIATDTFSDNIEGIGSSIPMFSMMEPNAEEIISLNPDVIFVAGMSKFGGEEPFKVISDSGICVIYIPSSTSIEAIQEDILFISEVMGNKAAGSALVDEMEKEIEAIRAIGSKITDKKTVYFEIAAAPAMYSFGKGVFLDELLEIIGAENIMANEDSWVYVADEAVLETNPDVILTSVDYLDDVVGEIMSRPGWNEITAVQNGDVYYVDTDASNRPSHNIVKALKEMAKYIYPDNY